MALWKKLIYSGSNAELNQVTASFFKGDGSALTGIISSSYAVSASYAPSSPSVSASYAATASVGGGIYGSSGVIKPGTIATIPLNDIFRFRFSGSGNDGIVFSEADGETVLGSPDGQSTFSLIAGGVINLAAITSLDLIAGNQYISLSTGTASFSDTTGKALLYGGDYSSSIITNDRFIPDVGNIKNRLTASFAKGGSGSFIGNGSGLTGIVSSSYSATSSFNTSIFSRATTYFVSGGMSVVPEAFTLWRTPYPCRVVALQGWSDVSGSSINARKSGSSGWSAHTSSFVLNKHSDWVSANSVINTDYSVNDTLQIMITGSTASSRVTIQIDFIRI